MVPRRRRGGGVARVEAEHDRSPGALSGGVPVRALYWDADPHRLGRNPVLRRALHPATWRACHDELARAVDKPGARLGDRTVPQPEAMDGRGLEQKATQAA